MTWEVCLALISAIAAVCGIMFGYKNSHRADEQQVKQDALALARVESKIDTINHGLDDMRIEIRSQRSQIDDINVRLIRVEERCDSICKKNELRCSE